MKKSLFSIAALSAVLTFTGCGANDAAEMSLDWGSNSTGNLEVVNTSNTDIVLFIGDRPTESGLMGGVKAGGTRFIDICHYVPDCDAGGWTIIRGITRDIYNENIANLTAVKKIDFSAMATYKRDQRYRIAIDYSTIGENAVRIANKGRVGMELRKDSPEGEKVAYLPALQQNQLMYTETTASMTLFPFYVLYNKKSQNVTTLKASSIFESVQVSPRPISGNNMLTYYFPNDEEDSWEKLIKDLKSPVAYIKVSNTVKNQSAYFTASGASRLTSQNGYDDIGPGEILVYELEASEATEWEKITTTNVDEETGETTTIDTDKDNFDKPKAGGIERGLVAVLYGGAIQVPVLFYDEDGNKIEEQPKYYNGYDYTVSISGSGSTSAGYKAVLKQGKKRDLSGELESL